MSRRSTIEWKCGNRTLRIGDRPLVMGILNVTPDSFSDGGRYFDTEAAVARGLALLEQGADILDVGGESTRPGSQPVGVAEEIRRVVPVIREVCRRAGEAMVSVDTRRAAVARDALAAGARIVNDVSALTHDPGLPAVARDAGAGVVLMHMQGTPATMQEAPEYDDVVREVRDYLGQRIADLTADGLDPDTLAVDPGIGFGKTVEHNLELLAHLDVLADLGRPVVVGVSRKSFLGKLTGRPVERRLAAGLAAQVFCTLRGAHVVRVHDVEESCDAARVAAILAGHMGKPEDHVALAMD